MPPPTSALEASGLSRALGSFAVIGGVGFAIEAVLLTLLTQLALWTPWQARVPSFITAVLVTWALNRRHTFAGRGLQRRSLEALSYVAIQVGGAFINLAIFGVCIGHVALMRQQPVLALGVGAIGGFAFNFAVSNAALYSRSRTGGSG